MQIEVVDTKLNKVKTDCLVLFLFEDEKISGDVEELDASISSSIDQVQKLGDFKGKIYQTVSIFTHGKAPTTRVLLVGLGKKSKFEPRIGRNAAGVAAKKTKSLGIKSLAVYLTSKITAEDVLEGVGMGMYDPGEKKKKKESEDEIEEIKLIGKAEQQTIKHSQAVVEASNWVRKLVNEPPNFLTPTKMVEEAKKLAKKYKIELEIIDEKKAGKMGMGAFAGIAKGSDEPSFMLILKYKGGGSETLGIAGKGITFDSGGMSLKPSRAMTSMKGDMAGAAAALGAMMIIGQMKPKVNIIMVCPITENMPSGRALKPDDVVKSLSGKSIEITNTDAEGRVVLADALTYLQKLGATRIIDLATLTGAVLVVLGNEAAAVIGNQQEWVDKIIESGEKAGERIWPLPMYDEYKQVLKSDVADIANAYKGHPEAGTIAGAVFLNEFVKEKLPWAHLDIAGTAWVDSEKPYLASGATGFGVRTLMKLVEAMEKDG